MVCLMSTRHTGDVTKPLSSWDTINIDYEVLMLTKCDALRNLVPFVQFKKREKHPWRSITFSKVVG